MTSEHGKAWNHLRHLRAASEGLWKDGHQDKRKAERKKKTASACSDPGEKQQSQGEDEKEEKELPAFSDPGEEQQDQEEGQEGGKQNGASLASEPEEEQRGDQDQSQSLLNTLSTGVNEGRLAELRSHLQAQFSIQEQQEYLSPGGQLMELVERIVHGEGADRTWTADGEVASEGRCPTCGQGKNSADCFNGLPALVEKTLQRELAALKGELMASIGSMRQEMAEELSSLREALQVYNEHRFFQPTDLSPLEELDENVPNQLKGGHQMIPQMGQPGHTISPDEKFKSRSVPTLHPLPISGRNHAMLRAAMTTISAQSSFASNLSRSNSDPVDPVLAKSTIFPPAVPKLATRKPPTKMRMPAPATRTYASDGKYSNKMTARTPALHPPCGDCEDMHH